MAEACSWAASPACYPAKVVVLGGGVVGINAAYVAMGMGADVSVMDVNLDRLRYLDEIWGNRIRTIYSSKHNIEEAVYAADLVIGAVLLPGAKTPYLITKDMLPNMKRVRSSSTSLSTRAAASRRRTRPRTPIPPTSSTAFSTTASPTCRVPFPTPRHSL